MFTLWNKVGMVAHILLLLPLVLPLLLRSPWTPFLSVPSVRLYNDWINFPLGLPTWDYFPGVD